MPRQSIATSDPVQARPCDILLGARGIVLGDHGYRPDSTLVERTTHGVVFYHYTHQKRWPQIVADGGLLAYQTLPTRHSPLVPEFEGCRHISGFLEPLPEWLTLCPYFGDFGLQHLQNCIGTLLLRVEVPLDFPGLYVRDYALQMESLCFRKQGREVLGLGFDHRTYKEESRATLHSYIPVAQYIGGHIAPVFTVVHQGSGIAIPHEFISICAAQPLQAAA